MATITPQAASSLPVLDPRTLGRPVHLLGRCAERLQKDLIEQFQSPLNRRYRSQFEIGEVAFDMGSARNDSQRWLAFSAEGGSIAFAADRSVLLCILAYRYGVQVTTATETPTFETVSEPETATEERLASRLGRQLAGIIAGTIEALQPDAAPAHLANGIEFADSARPVDSPWTLRVQIVERAHQLTSTLRFRLDERWISRLLRGLAPQRDSGSSQKSDGSTQPLTSRLQLTLAARLLEKEIELGTFLDLNVGDVIPVLLRTTDVLIGDSRLFTASLAEHKGKLCLTSFQDVE